MAFLNDHLSIKAPSQTSFRILNGVAKREEPGKYTSLKSIGYINAPVASA